MNDCNKFGCKKLVTRCEACGRTANEIVMPKAEWIRVKDRLPEVDKKVLVYSPDLYDQEPNVGFYDPGSTPDSLWRDEEYVDIKVTHWMALPAPPEINEVD